MGFGSRAFLAGGLGFAAAFVVACGSGNGLLSANESSTISSQLSAVGRAVNAGSCIRARSAANALNATLAALPSDVNPKLASNLGQGASTVKQLAARDCHPVTRTRSTSTTTPSTPTTSTPSTTTPTTTATSTATQTTTTTTTAPPTTHTNPNSISTFPTQPAQTTPQGGGAATTTNGGAGLGGGGH